MRTPRRHSHTPVALLLLAAACLACTARAPRPVDDVMAPPSRVEPAASSGGGASSAPPTAAVTTVLLVRHAERPPGEDPSLDATGQARAQALADALGSAGVTAIFTTQYRRTQETAAPLAQRLGITPQIIAARGGDSASTHATHVVLKILADHAGGVVLVVGHSNTIPLIVRALGGTAPDRIADSEYRDLFIVTVPGEGQVRTIRAKYGS